MSMLAERGKAVDLPIGTEPPRGEDRNPLMRDLPHRFVAEPPARLSELEGVLAEMLLLESTAAVEAEQAARRGDLERARELHAQAAAVPTMRRAIESELLELRVQHQRDCLALLFAHEVRMREVKAERAEALAKARASWREAAQAESRLIAARSEAERRVRLAERALAEHLHPRPPTATELIDASVSRAIEPGATPQPAQVVEMHPRHAQLRAEQGRNSGLKGRARKAPC